MNDRIDTYRKRLIRWGHMGPLQILRLGVRSFQTFFQEELDSMCQRHHRRGLVIDGEIGPCTESLLNRDRCDCPDKLFAQDAEQANWPKACRNNLKMHVELDRLSLDNQVTRQRFQAAANDWASKLVLQANLTNTFSESHIYARAGALGGSTLAWSQLARNSCSVQLEQRYNTRVNWHPNYFQGTVAHELGHAFGCPHLGDPGALMYPYMRRDIWTVQRPDIRLMVRLGYQERKGDPPPPDEPPGDPDWMDGLMQLTFQFADGSTVNYVRQ